MQYELNQDERNKVSISADYTVYSEDEKKLLQSELDRLNYQRERLEEVMPERLNSKRNQCKVGSDMDTSKRCRRFYI